MRCDWCGMSNPAGSTRCNYCGASFPLDENLRKLLYLGFETNQDEALKRRLLRNPTQVLQEHGIDPAVVTITDLPAGWVFNPRYRTGMLPLQTKTDCLSNCRTYCIGAIGLMVGTEVGTEVQPNK